eukprot:m.243136 g.243136  ORF g.243136 m.243136 type:complete len:392 (-) comp16097_c0_seq20:155-1330(-)
MAYLNLEFQVCDQRMTGSIKTKQKLFISWVRPNQVLQHYGNANSGSGGVIYFVGLQHIAVPSLGLCDYDLCVNVSQCALQASLLRGGLGKVGVVWADDLERPEGQRLHNFKELGSIVSVLKEIKNAEMALLVPEDKIAKHPLTAGEIEKLREHGITKIHYAEWMIPPNASPHLPTSQCHLMYLKLHLLNLAYSTVLFLGKSMKIAEHAVDQVVHLLQCSASGKYLATMNMPHHKLTEATVDKRVHHSPSISGEVLVVKPNDRVMKAAVLLAASLPPTMLRLPHNTSSSDCAASLLHAMFYTSALEDPHLRSENKSILELAGVPQKPRGFQLDHCVWNGRVDLEEPCGTIYNTHHAVIAHHHSKELVTSTWDMYVLVAFVCVSFLQSVCNIG